MSKPVYVVVIVPVQGSLVLHPEVFDSADGAKHYLKENWKIEPVRLSPSLWQGATSEVIARIHKRTVFKK